MSSPKSVESFTGSDTAADTSLERVFDCDMEEHNEGRKQVEETQFVDVDIDTQATTGDNRRGVAHSPQPVSPALSMIAKSKQFSFSLDDDDDAPAFAFGKAMIKTPAISLPRKGADQARVPAKEVAHAPTIDNDHAPKTSPQKHVEKDTVEPLQPSPPKPGKRAPLSSNDSNRPMSMGINQHGGDGDATKLSQAMPMAAMMSTAARHEHPTSMPTAASSNSQAMSLEPPLTQVAPPMAPRKARRKKTALAAMQYGVFAQQSPPNLRQSIELEPNFTMTCNLSRQQVELPHNTTIEAGNFQAPQTATIDCNTSFMAQVGNGENHLGTMHQIVDQWDGPPLSARSKASTTATVPTARIVNPQHASRSPPESGVAVEEDEAQIPRPIQTHAKQPSTATLPFPELGISSATRNSPMPVNRPLPGTSLQSISANVLRPVASAPAKVRKRTRSAAGTNFNGRADGGTGKPDARPQLRRVDAIREDKPTDDYAAGFNGSRVNGGQRNELVRPPPLARNVLPAPMGPLDLSAGLDLFDQAKNAFTAQVLEKDRELAHLKSEMDRLVETVQNLERDVSRLEGDKAKLRGDMYQKCESLKVKVGELLKDHNAVGGFIEKTNTNIAKFNKYREKSGSIFKEAIIKYADLQQHQKKTMEAIHDARMHVTHDIADLAKAHNHESGIVLKNLQAEKKKVLELEKALDSEKQKVMHLETRLDADLQDSIKAMFEKQSEAFAAKVENGGKELLDAINTRQEEKTASLKDYLKTLQAYREHETDTSQAIGELLSQITALSASVAEALKLKDTARDGLHKVGTEILNTIKEKVESISESHGNQAELANRVLLLETSKINLESQVKSETQARVNLQTQLEAKNAELGQNLAQLLLREQELKSLQSSLRQETTRSQQEAEGLRSSLATVNEELQELKETQTQLQEDNQTLHAQNSRLKAEEESTAERFRRSQEFSQQNAERLLASEDENSRVLRQAEAAESKMTAMQAKFTELTASTKQQLETQRIRMEEDKRRALQGTKSELSTLKKRYEKLEGENSSLKDTIAAQSDAAHLKQELSRLERENYHIKNSHASDLHKFGKVLEFQAQEIGVIRAQAAQLVHVSEYQELLRQIDRFKEHFVTAVANMENRLAYHEGIELEIRGYCEKQGWNYDEMDVENFFYQISATAVEKYRQSLDISSFSTQFPGPSMSFGPSTTAVATAGSPLQHSQSSATRHRGESNSETIQVPGTQTPKKGRRSPSMSGMPSRSPLASVVSPPRARRNQSIAERRRSLASVPKPTSPDTAGTPVRKPSDRTSGTGGRGDRAIPTPTAGNLFDIPDSSQGPSQSGNAGRATANSGFAPTFNTPAHPSVDANGRLDSDLSDLTDIMDLMDQQPEVDPIPALEKQRRQRASSIVEDSQSQRVKASTMEPPSTPRQPTESRSLEVKPLKSILKKPLKRDHSSSQQSEETASLAAPPRRQLQPLKGKNSLASLGPDIAGFSSSQDAGLSRAVGFRAREVSVIESATTTADVETTTPAINTGQRLKRTKTIRSGALESQTQATPAARTTRMSIPYKPSSSRK